MPMQAVKVGTIALWTLAVAGMAGAADLRMPLRAPPARQPLAGQVAISAVTSAAHGMRTTQLSVIWATLNSGPYSGGITAGRVEGAHSWNIGLDNSFIGGGTLGCNWQPVGSPFVFGIEGEGGYMKLEGSAFDSLISASCSVASFRGTPDVLGSAKVG